jgi:hypothetical protein
MKDKEKPLPRPPKTPFGRQRRGQEAGEQALLSDRMAEAAALGKLDQFLERELDSEHARSLAKMMLGMTGMMPGEAAPAQADQKAAAPPEEGQAAAVPPDVLKAVQGGNIGEVVDMLRQEHLKRAGGQTEPASAEQASPPPDGIPPQERQVLDRLLALAREHDVSPDWIVLRALKLYFEEYERTGRL